MSSATGALSDVVVGELAACASTSETRKIPNSFAAGESDSNQCIWSGVHPAWRPGPTMPTFFQEGAVEPKHLPTGWHQDDVMSTCNVLQVQYATDMQPRRSLKGMTRPQR